MKNIKGISIKIVVVLLIISLFYNLKLMKSTRELKNELYLTNRTVLQGDFTSLLKTMNRSISNNKIYIGEKGIVKDYYERDLREISSTLLDLSRFRSSAYSIDASPLRDILNSYTEFLDSLHKRQEKNQNDSEQYIDLNSNDLEGITIIKETMEDLLNIINSDQGNKDRWINILQEFTNYTKSKEFEEKRLKIEELNKALTQD
ncbi:hypothetical protein KHA93_18815 [Bacillus sp. FJAT-49732]|uniref:Uncharacterized protein n=1 Tax=Lederbergia citrisecunda TaxID=2833583 RepID=A0A942TQF3_9BACI|nr:hypothetical protein [Lederbergia citrisecunda]MBS4201658.1 hypothetical protein [Lederbergia citrisecunda]